MKKTLTYCIAANLLILIAGCSKHDQTPSEVVKEFYNAEAKADVDAVAATLAPELRSKIPSNKDEAKKGFLATKGEIDKCGGFKNLTSKYDISPGAGKVVGYTLVEHNGSCPTEKQAISLSKFDDKWLIDEFGPSSKVQ